MYFICHVLAIGVGISISVAVGVADFASVQNCWSVVGANLQAHQLNSSLPVPDCQGTLSRGSAAQNTGLGSR